ncbi:MAG: TIGR01777 family protein [Halobacteriovoraceae bacterium]|nr:TIGR01777 family protein [Halobacteriovoraceae bacterium]
MNVLVSGASGFVGRHIVELLLEKGHTVYALSRSAEENQKNWPKINWIQWNNAQHVADLGSINKLDAVINLAGEGLDSKRWSNGQKKEIFNSRVDGTKAIFEMLKAHSLKPEVFVSTSAVGIYGHHDSGEVVEDSATTKDFLANLCKDWEAVVTENSSHYDRSVIVRVGLVLGKGGGMISKLVPLFRLGLGGKLGSGNFFMSWIHVKDLARIYVSAIEDSSKKGVYNGTAPFPVKNAEFTKVLSDTVVRPAHLNVPRFALRIAVGEMADYMLKGAKVVPSRLKQEDFHFLYPTIERAIKDVVSKA